MPRSTVLPDARVGDGMRGKGRGREEGRKASRNPCADKELGAGRAGLVAPFEGAEEGRPRGHRRSHCQDGRAALEQRTCSHRRKKGCSPQRRHQQKMQREQPKTPTRSLFVHSCRPYKSIFPMRASMGIWARCLPRTVSCGGAFSWSTTAPRSAKLSSAALCTGRREHVAYAHKARQRVLFAHSFVRAKRHF